VTVSKRALWISATAAIILAGAASAGLFLAHAADPDALKKIVRDRCLPALQEGKPPLPCAKVDIARGLEKGYAILKDIRGDTQYLLITTALIRGIEDPRLLEPDSPNYWADAWAARSFVVERAGRAIPRDMMSLAVNSAYGRTQNQLHIHIDCVRSDVRALLKRHEKEIGPRFLPLPVPIDGRVYQAMRIEGASLDRDPFRLVAEQGPEIAGSMGRETIVVVGAEFENGEPGFYVLSDRAEASALNQGSGEVLQDHACAVLTPPPG